MAHGRTGPDIVVTTRYVGASAIRAVTEHEMERTPDGSSAIDPLRSHLNEVLHGPRNQQEAVENLWGKGVKKPAKQAENPFVQIVISASPGFFRGEGQGPGEWDPEKLQAWKEATLKWLRKEYGRDLAHVSLHLDEDTPHMHILLVPTYDKAPRKPGRMAKGETEAEFAARKAAAENAEPVRTAGRSSNAYWKRNFARRIARQSYHEAVAPLGLGYGKDFIGGDEPSPERKETGAWVREQAAQVREDRALIAAERAEMSQQREEQRRIWLKLKRETEKSKAEHLEMRQVLELERAELWGLRGRIVRVVVLVAETLGIRLPGPLREAIGELEDELARQSDRTLSPPPPPKDPFAARALKAEKSGDDPAPGL